MNPLRADLLSSQTIHLLWRAGASTKIFVEQAAAQCDGQIVEPLSLRKYRILSLLLETPGLSSVEVAAKLKVSRQAINEVATTLEAQQLIARQREGSNRKVRPLRLTAEGERYLEFSRLARAKAEASLLEILSEEEVQCLRNIALRVIAKAEAMAEENPAISPARIV